MTIPINNFSLCAENKYNWKPLRKYYNHTETSAKPNIIVHMDIFQIHRAYVCIFLSTIDRFTMLETVHKLIKK